MASEYFTTFYNPTVFFDIDDTLVMWDENLKGDNVCIEIDGHLNHMVINKGNLEELKRHGSRGIDVIVWSKGGVEWARAVVRALKIGNYVSAVMAKPFCYYDDLKNPLGSHRHFKIGEKYATDKE
jgi:FMN phosphatase YigB (HAD superfamily)